MKGTLLEGAGPPARHGRRARPARRTSAGSSCGCSPLVLEDLFRACRRRAARSATRSREPPRGAAGVAEGGPKPESTIGQRSTSRGRSQRFRSATNTRARPDGSIHQHAPVALRPDRGRASSCADDGGNEPGPLRAVVRDAAPGRQRGAAVPRRPASAAPRSSSRTGCRAPGELDDPAAEGRGRQYSGAGRGAASTGPRPPALRWRSSTRCGARAFSS